MAYRKAEGTFHWLLRPLSAKRAHFWRPVLISFLIAAAFWFLNALNHPHSAVIQRQLELVYDHSQLALSGDIPKHINLQVSGQGWSILRSEFSMTKKNKIKVPIEKAGTYRLSSQVLTAHARTSLPTLQVTDAVLSPFTIEAKRK